ncbi:MAG: glycosyltransferase family 39 protein [Chitinophagales bacterium]
MATLLFVAHPIHTEVVANIKSADEILCLLFSLTSLWAIVKYARSNRIPYLLIAAMTIFLGMLSKETAITMLVVAPLTVYFFSESNARKILISTISFIAAFALYIAIRISVLKGLTGFEEIQIINNSLAAAGGNSMIRIATAIAIIGTYL